LRAVIQTEADRMNIIVIGWLFVTLMMNVVAKSVAGGVPTFLF
jgi:hypothetical protein